MSPLTSIAGGVLLCALVGAFANQHYSWLTLGCAAIGSLLPHWCEHPRLTERFGPQTVTHSLLGLAVLTVFLSPLLVTGHRSLVTALLLGYATHLLLDAATERGVLLFYPSQVRAVLPRHPLSRVTPGSPRERHLRWWLLGLWVMALPLNAVGLRGLLHRLIPVAQFAVEDAIIYTSQGHRVFADFTGRFSASQRTVSGRWEVLEPTTRTSLLVEDPEGRRYVLGTHPHDTIQVFTIRARKGPPVAVRLQRVHLHEQVLGDLLPLIPRPTTAPRSGASRPRREVASGDVVGRGMIPSDGRTYLIGSIQTPEVVQSPILIDQFQPIQVGNKRIEFQYATADDLHAVRLNGLYVTDGEILLRTLLDGEHPAPSEPLATTEVSSLEAPHRTINVIIHHLADPTEIVVRLDQPVKPGDLLADLVRYRSTLLPEQRTVQAQLLAAQATLAHLRLVQQQELALKRTEDALAGFSRDLLSLQAKHLAELAHAQAHVEALSAKLDRFDQELVATQVRTAVSGRVLSVTFHQSTATLHLLADE